MKEAIVEDIAVVIDKLNAIDLRLRELDDKYLAQMVTSFRASMEYIRRKHIK